jgi:hypothetical protein
MAIYTRFGSEVWIVKGDLTTGNVTIRFLDDGDEMQVNCSELKADNGFAEIEAEIEKLNEPTPAWVAPMGYPSDRSGHSW